MSHSTESRSRVIWSRCWRGGLFIIMAYAGLCVVYMWHQDRHLFPGRVTQGRADSIVSPSADYESVHFTTASRDDIFAIFGTALDADDHVLPDAASRPTIIYFNGNGSTVASVLDLFHAFRRTGCNVLIPDYPGYGMSSGYASERAFCDCAVGAFDYAAHRRGVDPAQIVSVGWSLGAAVATDLAAHRPVMGLAVLSAFTSWPKEFGERSLWYPAGVWMRAKFDTESKFATLRCPVFIGHGLHDEAIPFTMAQRLAEVRGGVEPMAFDAGHALFETKRSEVVGAVGRFIEGLPSRKR